MDSIMVDLPCERCKINNSFKFYKIINLDKDLEVYNKIKNKTIFDCTCPKCGITDKGVYPFICYSDTKKLAFLFFRENKEDKKIQTLKNLGIESIENISEYTTRTVSTLEDLNEKIKIFEYSLNDAIIEVAKIWFVSTSNTKIEEIRFNCVKDDFIHWIVVFNGKMMGAKLPMDFYRESLEIWKTNITNNFPRIQKDTLDDFVTRIK